MPTSRWLSWCGKRDQTYQVRWTLAPGFSGPDDELPAASTEKQLSGTTLLLEGLNLFTLKTVCQKDPHLTQTQENYTNIRHPPCSYFKAIQLKDVLMEQTPCTSNAAFSVPWFRNDWSHLGYQARESGETHRWEQVAPGPLAVTRMFQTQGRGRRTG